jgi:acetyl-CoA acetyltransferase
MRMRFRNRSAAITGVGVSALGRRLGRSGLDLAIDAIQVAIDDAGLSISEIDGVACWPGREFEGAIPGTSPLSVWDLADAMGLNLSWYCGGPEGPAQLSSILNAVLAISAGQARNVLCYRASCETSTPPRPADTQATLRRVDDEQQWLLPYNSLSLANLAALNAQRHFHEFGTRREHLGWIAINARKNAALNPRALYRHPLSMEDYLGSRMISTPLCLYDCDAPLDGAVAIIISRADVAMDRRRPPIHIEAISGTLRGRALWSQRDLLEPAAFDAAADLWSHTDLKPQNVDVAQLYDGFTIATLNWLEALGFCARGESGAFVDGGERIALDGALPLNTGGGQLSGGRLHGLGHLHEAVVQLRGEGGKRQVQGNPRVAAVSNGVGPLASCALLVRE